MTATSLERSPAAHLSMPGWLDRLLLWIPRANRPGLLAFGLFLVRVTALPMVGAFLVLAPFSSALSAHPLLGISVMLAFSVLIEECGRYSFVRKAQRPGRALAERAWAVGETDPNSAVFQASAGRPAEDEVVHRFEDVDLHHPTWNEMAFVGVSLSPSMEEHLTRSGLRVTPQGTGFSLLRPQPRS